MKTYRLIFPILTLLLALNPLKLDAGAPPSIIPDPGLYQAVFDELGGVAPDATNMQTLTSLTADSSSYTIFDLTGLDYAINLEYLDLGGQDIIDYTPISSLTLLQTLYLYDNTSLFDLSFISGLDLFELDISYCGVSDLTPLQFMFNLFYLYASGNGITDITPLSGLSSLEYAGLDDNNILDFSPLNSTGYSLTADLYFNGITDISPATTFSSNASLYLDDNSIEDFSSLKNDTDLPYISLFNNPINAASFCNILPIIESNNYPGVIDMTPGLHTCTAAANIPDPALKSAVETALSIVNPTITDMTSLLNLTASGLSIADLTGLELAVNLMNLDLSNNSITDISPIQHLCQLQTLDLSTNSLDQNSFCTSLPLLEANNPALIDGVTLFTDPNPFTCPTVGHFIPDVNLRALVQAELGLGSEPTIPDMVNLITLFETFPFGGPPSNQVTDLTGLEYATNLIYLDLTNHNVSDLSPLSGLTSLQGLYMSGNNLSTITPLSALINLEFLYIRSNPGITSISTVSSFTSLRYLGCGLCSITSIAPVTGLSQLIEIQIDYNPVTDLTPIYGLANLTRLGLSGLSLTDISFLSTWPNLEYLALSSNPAISNLSLLSQFTLLESLYMYSMSLSDVSFLSTLINLQRLGLANNNIQDISSMANLTSIKSIFIYNNNINSIAPLTGLTTIETCLAYDNPLNPLAYCVHGPLIQSNNPGMFSFNIGTNTNPLTSDCNTNPADLSTFVSHWGRIDCNAGNSWCGGADFNQDGNVNLIDFVSLASVWLLNP